MGLAREENLGGLEQYRPYLRLLAGRDVDARFVGKLDLSGVVQQTLWEAYQDHDRYRGRAPGRDEATTLAWLRRILARNLLDELRRLGRKKSDLARERSIEDSSARLALELEANDTSPSVRAASNERAFRLARALEQLPSEQCAAVTLHHLQSVPLARIAEEMGRSKEAIAGLLHRGLVRLRAILREEKA